MLSNFLLIILVGACFLVTAVLSLCLQVLANLGAADIDSRLEEQLIDGILFAFQEQTNEVSGRQLVEPPKSWDQEIYERSWILGVGGGAFFGAKMKCLLGFQLSKFEGSTVAPGVAKTS